MTPTPLDSPQTYTGSDPAGLYERIAGLPGQFEAAYAAAEALPLPERFLAPSRVVVLGMGGSGIGGALLRALAVDLSSPIAVDVVRGYTLPAYVDASTLAIASSNSGNTEETLALAEEACARGVPCVAITTGGGLLALARDRGCPALQYAWEGEPRSALGWSFATLLAVCMRAGLFDAGSLGFAAAVRAMRETLAMIARDVPETANPAKQLAQRLAGRLPVVAGAEIMAPVAYRWRTQLNENGKTWAIAEELPEMNHNAPVGYAAPAAAVGSLHAVLLRHESAHPRVLKRLALTHEQLAAAGVGVETLDIAGSTPLAQMLSAAIFGDVVSYYVGILNGADPSENRALDWLKARMAEA